jgi:hypothetical protein
MKQHRPNRKQLQAFYNAMLEAQNTPEFTPEHLQFLAQRRDNFFLALKK